MKIYFSGAHCVGKSTLCRYVSKKYNLLMLPEAARRILAERELQLDSLRSDIDLVNSYQSDVFYRQIEEEKIRVSFVSDRCLIDSLAYSAQHSGIAHQLMNDLMFKDYVESLKDSIIFFVRPHKTTLKNDGVREHLTWDGVVAIDAMIKLLFQVYNIKYHIINTDSMQERISIIDNILSIKLV